jgi:hypothetical protein
MIAFNRKSAIGNRKSKIATTRIADAQPLALGFYEKNGCSRQSGSFAEGFGAS